MTLHLENIPWDQTLDIVLEMMHLHGEAKGGIIYVKPAENETDWGLFLPEDFFSTLPPPATEERFYLNQMSDAIEQSKRAQYSLDVWLSALSSNSKIQIISLEQDHEQLTLYGLASSASVLNSYLESLQKSKYFDDIELIGSNSHETFPTQEFTVSAKTILQKKSRLIERREIPDLLDHINQALIDVGLTISRFQPLGQKQQEFYHEMPIAIEVSGEFHQFMEFSRMISAMEQIVSLRNMRMFPQNDDSSEYKFFFNAIVFSLESIPTVSIEATSQKFFPWRQRIAWLEQEQQYFDAWLHELNPTLGENLQLTSFEQKDEHLTIHGIASSNLAISDYLRDLEKSKFFNDIELLSSIRHETLSNREFTVSVNIKFQTAGNLTERGEIPNVLDHINETLIDAGLAIYLFRPLNQEQKEFYHEIPVEIEVSGEYHQFLRFSEAISNMENIVNLRNIRISPQDDEPSGKKFSFTAVVFSMD